MSQEAPGNWQLIAGDTRGTISMLTGSAMLLVLARWSARPLSARAITNHTRHRGLRLCVQCTPHAIHAINGAGTVRNDEAVHQGGHQGCEVNVPWSRGN